MTDDSLQRVIDEMELYSRYAAVPSEKVHGWREILAALSAQTEARDAARYRWLKKGRKTKDELLAFILIKDVDAAIDKAIAQGDL